MTSYPFTGNIPVSGAVTPTLSGFAKTEWDTDTPTVTGQTAMAYRKTDWSTDNGTAEPAVRGFSYSTDNWS